MSYITACTLLPNQNLGDLGVVVARHLQRIEGSGSLLVSSNFVLIRYILCTSCFITYSLVANENILLDGCTCTRSTNDIDTLNIEIKCRELERCTILT
jgi:hypothetical protein